jgi:hypothetical protein
MCSEHISIRSKGGIRKWWGSLSCNSLPQSTEVPANLERSFPDSESKYSPAYNPVCLRICPVPTCDEEDEASVWEWKEDAEHGEIHQLDRGVKAAIPSYQGPIYGPNSKTEAIFENSILEVIVFVSC